MNKEKLYKSIPDFFLFILLTLNIYYLYRVYTDYQNIYQIQYFIPILFILLIRFLLAIVRKRRLSKTANIINLFILILIPIIIHLTIPKYTYADGKESLRKKFKDKNKLEFIQNKDQPNYLPTSKNNNFFLKDRAYYYAINLDNENKYFSLDSKTGVLKELEESFW